MTVTTPVCRAGARLCALRWVLAEAAAARRQSRQSAATAAVAARDGARPEPGAQ